MSKKRAHQPTGATAIGGYLVKGLQQQLAEKRIPVFNQTKVLSLVKNDGHISGVEIEHPQAGKKIINAKTVLIASGGFAQNRAMMSVYAPDLLRLGTTNHPGATGDGIKLATTARWCTGRYEQSTSSPNCPAGNGSYLFNRRGIARCWCYFDQSFRQTLY